jgi:5-(carboxyamino)imidazole ribonucleotide synthase
VTVLPPGSALGIVGGGQLGWLFGKAAKDAGFRFHVLTPEDSSPATTIADSVTTAALDDVDAFRAFARGVAALTIDTEHISSEALDAASRKTRVCPAPGVIATTQSRLRMREVLGPAGLPLVPYRPVSSAGQLERALAEIGIPSILKSATEGYDGKGQVRIRGDQSPVDAWEALGTRDAVLEQFIPFAAEFSVIVARGPDGEMLAYEPFENVHTEGILDHTVWPSRLDPETAGRATSIAQAAAEVLDVVGLLCVEFFLLDDGTILINECAARTHNSGHLTIEAAETSQYDQVVRILAGMPLGSTRRLRAAAMANLVGGLHVSSSTFIQPATPEIALYDYGKSFDDRRKLGHLVAVDESDPLAALADALSARAQIATRAVPGS